MHNHLKNSTLSKKVTFFLVVFTFLLCSEVKGQYDSLKKHKLFIIGFGGGVNNTLLYYPLYRDQLDRNNVSFNDQKICFAGEGELFVGFKTKRKQITLGMGYANYQSKNLHIYNYPNTSITQASVDYIFYHKFYKGNLNINWLVGENNRWIIGANLDCGVLFYFKEFSHVEYTLGQNDSDYTYEYPSPQIIMFTGINYGRLFKIAEHIDFAVSFNTKISSRILGATSNASNIKTSKTPDRNLFVKTLNFNLIFKI